MMYSELCNAETKVLPHIKTTPVSRKALSVKAGMSDRKVRDNIMILRQLGYPVCSTSDGSGYWLGDRSDVIMTIKEMRSRARSLLETAEAMEKGR